MTKKTMSMTSRQDADLNTAGPGATDCRSWIQRPMFWRPNYLAPSAWQTHVPFAFWLMQAHRPRVLVELGVHYGVSYFAFCQAASRLGLDASCYGIDTFKGDAHSGAYDGSVYEQVKKHNDAQYSGFSSLLRSTFDDALGHFENGSVDLLHIDGMHTFEAVRADFESWQKKLSPRAVVVMHDTNVRERGFGVAQMFRDLCGRYPHFEFIHGHGLGILGIGKQQSKQLRQLFDISQNESERLLVREAFSVLGQGCADAFQAERNEEKAAAWHEQAESRDKQTKYFQQCLEKAKSEIDELNGRLAEHTNTRHAEKEKLAHEKGNLEGRLEILDSIRLQLTAELVQGQARTLDTRAPLEPKAKEEAEALKNALQEYEAKNRQLESELEAAVLQLDAAREEKNALEITLQQLTEERTQRELTSVSLEQANHELSGAIVLFQSENSKLKMELADCAAQKAESDRVAEDAQKRSGVLTEDLSGANQKVQDLELQLMRENASVAKLKTDLTAAHKKAAELELEGTAQAQRIRREADAQLDRLKSENSNLRMGLEDARVQLGGLRTELNKVAKQRVSAEELSVLQRKHAEQMQSVSEEVQQHKKQLSERFAELAEMTKMLEEQSAAIRDKDSEAQAMASSMEELKDNYERALQELNENKTEIGVKTASLEDRFREIAMLTQIVQQRDAELNSKNEELELEKERAEHFRDLLEAQTSATAAGSAASPEGTPATAETKTRKSRAKRSRLTIDTQISLLDKSEILNKDWYLEQYEDVAKSGMNPAEHYVRFGAAEGRQPGPDFDTSWYVTNYPDVAEAGVNPAVHYLKYGKKEGRATFSVRRG